MEQKKFIPNQNRHKFERVIVGTSEQNKDRRLNLLTNAERGLGKVKQVGKHLSYIIGNDNEGYIEYFILHATLQSNENQ